MPVVTVKTTTLSSLYASMYLLYLFWYSGLILVLTCSLFLSVLLFALREAFKLQPVKREAALLVHITAIFVHISYIVFVAHRLPLF